MLIANVPLAPNGFWEKNASTMATTNTPTSISSFGMMLPTSVDALGIAYAEVMFTDTSSKRWFTVSKTSPFYVHNYAGACGDPSVVENGSFQITGRSEGAGDLHAWWGNSCPNNVDTVTSGAETCTAAFVNFDLRCVSGSEAAAHVQAYVR